MLSARCLIVKVVLKLYKVLSQWLGDLGQIVVNFLITNHGNVRRDGTFRRFSLRQRLILSLSVGWYF